MECARTERKLRLGGALAPWHKAREAAVKAKRARTARVANGGIRREAGLLLRWYSPPEVDQSTSEALRWACDLVGHGGGREERGERQISCKNRVGLGSSSPRSKQSRRVPAFARRTRPCVGV